MINSSLVRGKEMKYEHENNILRLLPANSSIEFSNELKYRWVIRVTN